MEENDKKIQWAGEMAGLNARVDIYDPEKGDSKHDIPAGTKIENLPDDWKCPRCKRKKEKFKVLWFI